MMTQNKFPPGWDETRVRSVIAHYEQQTEDENKAAFQGEDSTLMAIPTELVPAVLELIDKHIAVKQHQRES